MTILTTLTLAFLICMSTLTIAQQRGGWRNLSKRGSLGNLVERKWAFNVKGNIRYCSKRTIVLPRDGRADYTKIMNEKLHLLGSMGGGTLRLNRGVYTHSLNIILPSYVCLVGAGMYRTTLKLNDNSRRFKYSGNIRSMETERVTVMHMTVDGNRFKQARGKSANYGRYGFFSELTNWLYLYRVRVIRHAGYGFDPHGSKKHWSYYLIVDDCRAENNGLDGFTIDQTVHATISRGISTKNDRHGFNIVTGTQLAVFRNNHAVDNGAVSGVGYGIVAQNNQFYGTSRLSFIECTTNGDFRGAIKLRDVNNIYVENCDFVTGTRGVCYELAKTYRIFLRRNRCVVTIANRKLKIQPGALFTEKGARDVFRRRPAPQGRMASRPKPLSNNGSDPECRNGKRFSNVCCSASCKICGRLGCGRNINGPGPEFCCVTSIRRTKRSCGNRPAPCIMPTFL